MDIAHTPAAERIARVLATQRLSANADGDHRSVGDLVDGAWKQHIGDALAILKTLREPDRSMVDVGDAAIWARMVEAAIAQAEQV